MTPTPDKPTEQLSGLELRAAVAVEVMGAKRIQSGVVVGYEWPGPFGLFSIGSVPAYESDRTAAGMVLERIADMGLMHRLCHYLLIASGYDGNGRYNFIEVGLGATPEQICRAALAVPIERSNSNA